MMGRHFYLALILLQTTVAGLSLATLSTRNKTNDLSNGTNTTLRARHQRATGKSWKKEPYCINKESACQCPISPAYKESPAPRCFGSQTYDVCGRRVCYYNSEAHLRTSTETTGQPDLPYYVFDAPGCLCTHLVYGFALVDSNLNNPSSINLLWPFSTDVPCARPCKEPKQEPNLDHPGMVNCMKYAKRTNPSLKTLLGVGGKGQSNEQFSFMLKTPETRGIFIKDLKTTLSTYDFQGVDINLPFPGFSCNGMDNDKDCSHNSMDKYRFTSFLKELRQGVPPEMIITATVSCRPDLIHTAYEPDKIIFYVDWLNLMTYDLHDRQDQQRDHPSRLNPKFDGDQSNVKWCVDQWINSAWKADPSRSTHIRKQIKRKVVLGLNLYASIYRLAKPNPEQIQENTTQPPLNVSRSQVKNNTEGNTSSITELFPSDSLTKSLVYTDTNEHNMSSYSNPIPILEAEAEQAQNGNPSFQEVYNKIMVSKTNVTPIHEGQREPAQNASVSLTQAYTKTEGYMTSYELCQLRRNNFFVDSRLDELNGKEPIAENAWNFIPYEDAYSLREKVTYATNIEDLGGVMIWDITADDFRGEFCQQGNHPLLHSIVENCIYEKLTPKPEVVVSRDPQCGDKRADPSGTGYWQLDNGKWILMPCAEGTAFNTKTCMCDWPQGGPPARKRPPMADAGGAGSKTASKAGSVLTVTGLRAGTTLAVALALMAATLAPW